MYYGNRGKWDPDFTGEITGMNNLPDCLNIDKIGNIEGYQIGWCD